MQERSPIYEIHAEGDYFTVEVSAHMDDLWDSDDLIYDALSTVCSGEEKLPVSIIASIRNGLESVIDYYTDITVELPASATFEEIMKADGKAETEHHRNV